MKKYAVALTLFHTDMESYKTYLSVIEAYSEDEALGKAVQDAAKDFPDFLVGAHTVVEV